MCNKEQGFRDSIIMCKRFIIIGYSRSPKDQIFDFFISSYFFFFLFLFFCVKILQAAGSSSAAISVRLAVQRHCRQLHGELRSDDEQDNIFVGAKKYIGKNRKLDRYVFLRSLVLRIHEYE